MAPGRDSQRFSRWWRYQRGVADEGSSPGDRNLPEQARNGGICSHQVTEGAVAKETIEGNQADLDVLYPAASQEPEGEILDGPKLNRDDLSSNGTNECRVKRCCSRGHSLGLTDCNSSIEPPDRYAALFVDNQGVQNNGRWEGACTTGATAVRVDDRLTFRSRFQGNINSNVAYNIG